MLTKEELNAQLREVDQQLVDLLVRRMDLCRQVAEWKQSNNQPILSFKTEDNRLAEIREWAEAKGLNPNFASAILYLIIRESCAVQIKSWQDRNK